MRALTKGTCSDKIIGSRVEYCDFWLTLMCVPFEIKNFSELSAREAVLSRTERAITKILGIKGNAL